MKGLNEPSMSTFDLHMTNVLYGPKPRVNQSRGQKAGAAS